MTNNTQCIDVMNTITTVTHILQKLIKEWQPENYRLCKWSIKNFVFI